MQHDQLPHTPSARTSSPVHLQTQVMRQKGILISTVIMISKQRTNQSKAITDEETCVG